MMEVSPVTWRQSRTLSSRECFATAARVIERAMPYALGREQLSLGSFAYDTDPVSGLPQLPGLFCRCLHSSYPFALAGDSGFLVHRDFLGRLSDVVSLPFEPCCCVGIYTHSIYGTEVVRRQLQEMGHQKLRVSDFAREFCWEVEERDWFYSTGPGSLGESHGTRGLLKPDSWSEAISRRALRSESVRTAIATHAALSLDSLLTDGIIFGSPIFLRKDVADLLLSVLRPFQFQLNWWRLDT